MQDTPATPNMTVLYPTALLAMLNAMTLLIHEITECTTLNSIFHSYDNYALHVANMALF